MKKSSFRNILFNICVVQKNLCLFTYNFKDNDWLDHQPSSSLITMQVKCGEM